MTGGRNGVSRIAACLVGAAGALAFAAPAAADVTVDPAQAPQGGFAGVTFRVPNESNVATMTRVDVQLPDATPIAEVYTYSVPDWTPNLTTVDTQPPGGASSGGGQTVQVVSAITWSAAPGKATEPGGVAELSISLWPLPNTDRLAFTVVQTYSDGTVTRSSDTPDAGGQSPKHPAPFLKLVPQVPQDQDPGPVTAPADEAGGAAPTSDGDALTIALSAGATGVLLGLLLGIGLGWIRRGRAPAASPALSNAAERGTGTEDP